MDKKTENLNSLLKGELSAVESYEIALKHAKTDHVIAAFNDCMQCHAKRANALSGLITQMGGEPALKSGAWGAFAKTVEAGSAILGEGPSIGSLQEGEDQGIELYKAEMKNLEEPEYAIVRNELYPAQERTQKRLADLKVKV